MRGVVAAGHPLTAQAGADVLRGGGNAVDAAVACVLMSFVAESPLTGPGAGGFMLVHTPRARRTCSTSSSPRPGSGSTSASRPDARADRRALRRGRDAALQRRPCVVRRLRHHARARRGAASASARARSSDLTAAPARRGARGRRGRADAGVPVHRCWSRSSAPPRSARRSTRPRAGCSRRATRSGCPSSATCSTGSAPRGRASCTRATWPPR